MTTEELIPVLKALHADPRCSPMMADWFEEHGDGTTAAFLRTVPSSVFNGDTLIQMMQRRKYPSATAVRFAVVTESLRRLETEMRVPFADFVTMVLRQEIERGVITNTGRHDWRFIASDGHSAGVGRSDFTFVQDRSPSGVLWRLETGLAPPFDPYWRPLPIAVQMCHGEVGYSFPVTRLDGAPLTAYADLWYGVDGDQVLVSEFRPDHVRFWRGRHP